MVRTVNEAAYTARRNAILDATLRAIQTKGYEQMAIADLLSELQMSSGAFYHYFDSKPALLSALVERAGDQGEQLVRSIIDNPGSGAIEKLQGYFATLDRWKLANRELIFAFMRVWLADENAIVRHKLYITRIKRLGPLLEKVIHQGIEEGVFTTPYPDQAARWIISLTEDIGYAASEILLSEERSPDDLQRLERIVNAGIDAMERVLGAPEGSLQSLSLPGEYQDWLVPSSEKKEEA